VFVKSKVILVVLLGFVAILLSISFTLDRLGSTNGGQETIVGRVESGSVSVNSPAPGFTLPDPTGISIHLDDYLGKIVIVNFWATWCAPCREEMPVLDEYAIQHSEAVIVLGVAVNDSTASVLDFLHETPVGYPIVIDDNGAVGAVYHVAGYPTTYFIDAAGIIRGKFIGTLTPRILQQNLLPLGITE
jgi:cytochrome c biogenesis protein CcmG, thiol:disulfide interchange protein DsbE